MEYDFDTIEGQEAHFELTQDTFLKKDRAKYISEKQRCNKCDSSSRCQENDKENKGNE